MTNPVRFSPEGLESVVKNPTSEQEGEISISPLRRCVDQRFANFSRPQVRGKGVRPLGRLGEGPDQLQELLWRFAGQSSDHDMSVISKTGQMDVDRFVCVDHVLDSGLEFRHQVGLITVGGLHRKVGR